MSNAMSKLLADELVAVIDRGECPDCGERGFVFGPRGGACMNVECANLKCRARFNVVQLTGSHHIYAAHRIHKQSEGGTDWS